MFWMQLFFASRQVKGFTGRAGAKEEEEEEKEDQDEEEDDREESHKKEGE